jgi:mono/diheme cytochrome c family protein
MAEVMSFPTMTVAAKLNAVLAFVNGMNAIVRYIEPTRVMMSIGVWGLKAPSIIAQRQSWWVWLLSNKLSTACSQRFLIASTPITTVLVLVILMVQISDAKANEAQTRFHYQMFCQGCHTPGGTGGSGVPPLLNNVGHFLKTAEGRAYLMQVPGVAYTVLNDAQLAEVMNWLIRRYAGSSMPELWKPYTAEETARYRQTPLRKVLENRQRILAAAARIQ